MLPHSCKFGFVCPVLNDNICGDYKIQIGSAEVCRPNAIYKGNLAPDGEIFAQKVSATDSNETGKASCYLWCTPDGDLSNIYAGEAPTIALVSELQSRLDEVHNRTMAPTRIIKDDDVELEALSPVRIYKFHVEEENVKCEDEQFCEVTKRFAWLGEVQDANSTFCLFGIA